MTTEEAKKRRTFIPGKVYQTGNNNRKFSRAKIPKVYNTDRNIEPNIPDNFFDFDDELSEAQSARKLYEKIELERMEKERLEAIEAAKNAEIIIAANIEPQSFISFDEVEQEDANIEQLLIKEIEENEVTKEIVAPAFKQCEFIKENSERCKRQAPKDKPFCRAHSK